MVANIGAAMVAIYRRSDMMRAMNWPQLLEALRERGWTQVLLAERLGIAQSYISDLKRGANTDPRHSVGEAIRRLHDSGEEPPLSAADPAPAAQPAAAEVARAA